MATILTYNTLFSPFFIFLLLSPFFIPATAKFSDQFLQPDAGYAHRIRIDKMTHLHFYFHDIVSGKHPTATRVAGEKNKFGMTTIIDDPLTEGTEPRSRVVGRAQGMYTSSSQDASAILMVMNLEFLVGKYNGSTLSLLGRNAFMETVREIPVVGGTGLFRFARGYALAKTHRFNVPTGDAVVEYNVFVMHN